ncbi:hypothetical protein BKI52_26595 [marine bacterium AO1-C]|nr:hypothetical protein BKI52_26595 [marine bacterium AO1-C]
MQQWNDDELKKLFGTQKVQDSRMVPNFDQMWETTLQESQNPKKSYWRFSMVAAGFLVLMNVGIWQLKPKKNLDVSALTEWTSPTNSLLPNHLANNTLTTMNTHERSKQASMNISNWQSPTDALLPDGIY